MAFDLIDQNQDGVVNVTELHEMLSMLGIDLSIEILQTLIINLSKSGKTKDIFLRITTFT